MFTVATTMAQAVVGVPVFAAILGLGLRILWVRAAQHGVLKPVLVGLVIRLAIMIAAHVASVLGGGGGVYFLDDRGYDRQGQAIARAWLDGQVIDPSAYEYAGSVSFGFPVLVGLVYTLIGPVTLGVKLVNVLLGAGIVLLVGLLAGRLFGERAKLAAAWVAALLPTLIWWSAPLLKEPLVTFVLTAGLLAALSLPRLSALAGLGASVALLLITRMQGAAVLAGTVALVGIGSATHAHRRRAVLFVAAGAVILGAVAVTVTGQGPAQFIADIRLNGTNMLDFYNADHPTPWPYDAARSLLGPFPWVFSATTENWDLALYPGVWVLYGLYPTILVGLWRLRIRPFVLAYLALPAVAFVLINAIFAGLAFRQRVTIEPLLVLLAIAGADSWRAVARRGAIAIALVAPIALVHVRSIPVALAIAAGAGVLWLISRRLSCEPTGFLDDIQDTQPPQLSVSRADVLKALTPAVHLARRKRQRAPD